MRQFVGHGSTDVHDLLLSVAPTGIRSASASLEAAELAMMERDDEPNRMTYAHALAEWNEAGGYEAEVLWDVCTTTALGVGYDRCRWRQLSTLSGGEQAARLRGSAAGCG
ncbi:MAG TPA: ABC transporter ATP-binding protein, partial [Jiangellaceae bacterium]|nr:ABC transporter ATP-binding protein [Jiangellaceae bacterium]